MSYISHTGYTVSTQTGLPTLFGRCTLSGNEAADRVEPKNPATSRNPRYQRPPQNRMTVS